MESARGSGKEEAIHLSVYADPYLIFNVGDTQASQETMIPLSVLTWPVMAIDGDPGQVKRSKGWSRLSPADFFFLFLPLLGGHRGSLVTSPGSSGQNDWLADGISKD